MHQEPKWPQRPLALGPQPFQQAQQLQELHLPLDLQHPQRNVIFSNMSKQPQPSQHPGQPRELKKPQPAHQCQLYQHSQTPQQPQQPREPQLPKKPQPAHQFQLYQQPRHLQAPQQPQPPKQYDWSKYRYY